MDVTKCASTGGARRHLVMVSSDQALNEMLVRYTANSMGKAEYTVVVVCDSEEQVVDVVGVGVQDVERVGEGV